MRRRRFFYLGALAGLAMVTACAEDFDTSRQVPKRGNLGEEVYGVLCDRVSAQALHEDITGGSFQAICHKSAAGTYADKVDQTKLPPPAEGAIDKSGKPVSVAQQKENRAIAVARVEVLARRREDLVGALNATFPDVKVAVKDLKNSNAAKSCDAPTGSASGERKLHEELADMLGRFQDLYNDGTIPHSTESLGALMNAFRDSPEAQIALARFDSRQGYRPVEITLGAARPVVAYPQLRDLANATLGLMSADSDPYEPAPKRDAEGRRIPKPGAAHEHFTKLMEVMHEELRVVQPDPVAPLLQGMDAKEAGTDRYVLSRPRQTLEMLEQVLMTQNEAFGSGTPRYIVKRDPRGYAKVPLVSGLVPAPFVDANKDGLPDVDSLGRFFSTTGSAPPSPFFAINAPAADTARDAFGRAIAAGQPSYEYIDTSHTFAASMLADLKPLVDPDTSKRHETMMYMIAGAHTLFGERDGDAKSQRSYTGPEGGEPVKVSYTAFHPETSPLLDLAYAFGQVLGDKSSDDTLAYTAKLFDKQLPQITRVAGAALEIKSIADKHTEAQISPTSVFWDEMLDVVGKTAQEPGLLEDILRALGEEDSLALGPVFSNYLKFNDRISYDRKNINGAPFNLTTNTSDEMKTLVDRAMPDVGMNRSAMQRFSQLVVETRGVTACNKDHAIVHGKGVPIAGSIDMPLFGGSYKECEVFKIENLAEFYIKAIVGRAELYFRPSLLRNGVAGIGAATVDMIQQSSGLEGFWDAPGAKKFRPTPKWLNRLVFFDLANDSNGAAENNFAINTFVRDLNGPNIGSAVCPERVINDPDPTAADASPDGKVHGLRTCADGDWIGQRGADTLFTLENFGFYKAITPLLLAYVNHKREDLFLDILGVLHRHYADEKGAPAECKLSADPTNKCTKDGVVRYEPLLSEAIAGDLLPALHDLTSILTTQTITRCDEVDARTHACTSTSDVNGITVMAAATRALVDPAYSASIGLKDRHGAATALRNDGSTNPQVTPVYLLANALSGIDHAFDAWAASHPEDRDRQAMWRTGRSQLVDQFLGVRGVGKNATFVNQALPKITPTLLDITRAQLFAHCPKSFSEPFERCTWARDEITAKMADVVKGPAFAALLDTTDAIRSNDEARTQLEAFITYMLNSASQNEAFPAMLASSADAIQVLRDEVNLVPLYHVLAQATSPSEKDRQGRVTKTSLIDAQTALLARISGRAFDKEGYELCNKELDPNQILPIALANMVTPMVNADGKPGQTPLEVIMDIVSDVNRTVPGSGENGVEKLQPVDYANIADNVSDFLLNKESGLEQFYAIVRQGIVR